MMSKTIIAIHGASSSPISFNFLEKVISNDYVWHKMSYDSNVPIKILIQELYKNLPKDKPLVLIGHSLGGVLATLLTYASKFAEESDRRNIQKVVAISSPFGGSKAANYLKWMYPGYGLFDNIATGNTAVTAMKDLGAIVPTLSIVTTGGEMPLIKGPNDGVLTVSSQSSLEKAQIESFFLNHFEVLLSYDVALTIENFIEK